MYNFIIFYLAYFKSIHAFSSKQNIRFLTFFKPISRHSVEKASKGQIHKVYNLKPLYLGKFSWTYDAYFSKDEVDAFQSISIHDGRYLVIRNVTSGKFQPPNTLQSQNKGSPYITAYDLSSPRQWLEFFETDNKDTNFSCTDSKPGAYTVLRCDGRLSKSYDKLGLKQSYSNEEDDDIKSVMSWNVWGKEFHWNRLRESFSMLVNQYKDTTNQMKESLDQAVKDSDLILNHLTEHLHYHIDQNFNYHDTNQNNESSPFYNRTIQMMATILWTVNNSSNQNVLVRGHLSCINSYPESMEVPLPNAIDATIALPFRIANRNNILNETQTLEQTFSNIDDLPNRYNNSPLAKISSWCRLRKPLESINAYKPLGIGEVLLVRGIHHNTFIDGMDNNNSNSMLEAQVTKNDREFDLSNIKILEGLTSNFFAVFANGTIRTAESDILHGYARDLVLQVCSPENKIQLNLTYDPLPISIHDLSSDDCVETFITSSIRLIVPLQKIYLPKYYTRLDKDIGKSGPGQEDISSMQNKTSSNFVEIWTQSKCKQSLPWKTLRSEAIYRAILSLMSSP